MAVLDPGNVANLTRPEESSNAARLCVRTQLQFTPMARSMEASSSLVLHTS